MPANYADKLTDIERVKRAKVLTEKLVDHARSLIAAAENNAVVLYSDTLSSQIPRSFAANAFNEFQQSMQFYFLVRLSATWDKPSSDRESLPSLIALLDKRSVREWFAEDIYNYHASTTKPRNLDKTTDPDELRALTEHWERFRVQRAIEAKARAERYINSVVRIVPRLEQSWVAPVLRPFRDSYIAHNLDAEVNTEGEPKKLRYGDEAKLLRLTIRIVDRLHLAINGASFAWDLAQEHARRNATDLWSSCRFELSGR